MRSGLGSAVGGGLLGGVTEGLLVGLEGAEGRRGADGARPGLHVGGREGALALQEPAGLARAGTGSLALKPQEGDTIVVCGERL